MDLLSALTSTARYSLANFNFKLRSGAEATGYSTSMFKEAALQNLLQFPNDPYTVGHADRCTIMMYCMCVYIYGIYALQDA
jgi:hypothetical protein